MAPKASVRPDLGVLVGLFGVSATCIIPLLISTSPPVTPPITSLVWWRLSMGFSLLLLIISCSKLLWHFVASKKEVLLDACYKIQGKFLSRTLKGEVDRLIPQMDVLAARMRNASDAELRDLLTRPKNQYILAHAVQVQSTLRKAMRSKDDVRVFIDLDNLLEWDDDKLGNMTAAFKHLLPRIDPRLPALPRLPRRMH
jgi:hypothetical protein